MNENMDKETAKAWQGWVTFTKLTTVSAIAVAVVLSLMALLLI